MSDKIKRISPLTPEEIAEAERLCQEATPGPWDERIKREKTHIWMGTSKKPIVDVCGLYGKESDANAAFIASARSLIPRLLAQVKALTAERVDVAPGFDSIRPEGKAYD